MQPKTNQKLLLRSAIGLFVLAAFFYGFQWFKNWNADLDLGVSNTKGWIAALEYVPGGTRAAVIRADGTILRSPSYVQGAADRDVTWRPDGNRIYFASDREDKSYNIYRWNLDKGLVDRRTLGKLSKMAPAFPEGLPAKDNLNPLIVYGGMAWELDPANGEATQVYPPKQGKNEPKELRDETTDQTGSGLGSSGDAHVRQARYFGGMTWVAVISKTESGGDLLRVQKLDAEEKKQSGTLAAGDRIFMDVDPKSGRLFFSVLGFQWPDPNNIPPEFIVKGVAKKPFQHYLWFFDPATGRVGHVPIAASTSDQSCFSQIAVSPDGAELAVTVGPYRGNGDFETRGIFLMPAQEGAAAHAIKIFPPVEGGADFMITSLSWSPSGHQLAFGEAKKDGRVIAVVDDDGRNFKELTKGQGSFGLPKYSPQ